MVPPVCKTSKDMIITISNQWKVSAAFWNKYVALSQAMLPAPSQSTVLEPYMINLTEWCKRYIKNFQPAVRVSRTWVDDDVAAIFLGETAPRHSTPFPLTDRQKSTQSQTSNIFSCYLLLKMPRTDGESDRNMLPPLLGRLHCHVCCCL